MSVGAFSRTMLRSMVLLQHSAVLKSMVHVTKGLADVQDLCCCLKPCLCLWANRDHVDVGDHDLCGPAGVLGLCCC